MATAEVAAHTTQTGREVLPPTPEGLQVVIINDCSDPNAEGRQRVRAHSLFPGVPVTFIGLRTQDPERADGLGIGTENADLEAAGQLVDILKAAQIPAAFPQSPKLVWLNVAPRGSEVRERYENGTPFCHAKIAGTIVVSTFEGRSLALAHKLRLVDEVSLLDIPTVTRSQVATGLLTSAEAEAIDNSQIRSVEFEPLVARLLVVGVTLPAETRALERDTDVDGLVWFTDNFNNIKTTSLPEELGFRDGKKLKLVGGQTVTCYQKLGNVPSGELALTIGSSGYGEDPTKDRFIEVVRGWGRAAVALDGVKIGERIIDLESV